MIGRSFTDEEVPGKVFRSSRRGAEPRLLADGGLLPTRTWWDAS